MSVIKPYSPNLMMKHDPPDIAFNAVMKPTYLLKRRHELVYKLQTANSAKKIGGAVKPIEP